MNSKRRIPQLASGALAILLLIISGSVLSQQQRSEKEVKAWQKKVLKQAKAQYPNLPDRILRQHLAIIYSVGIYDDPELSDYVEQIGQKMLAVSEHAGREYHFFVLDDPVPNAFTPGHGVIYVNRGLLMLLQSEAQLAGVLAHEIGHNIGRHVARAKNKRLLGNVVANTASVLAGNTAVGSAINTRNQVANASFGREMELEADAYAAEYLYAANYEPIEMLGALSALADAARVQNQGQRYHSLGDSHPRTDKRLRGVISSAGELPPGEAELGREEYRAAIDGMVFGPNLRSNAPAGYRRYNNQKLGITFLYPQDWDAIVKGAKIVVKNPEQTLQFKIEIEKNADLKQSTKDALEAKYTDGLSKVEKIDPKAAKDLGVIAKHKDQRVGLVNVARNTYHFSGIGRDGKLPKDVDQVFIGMIASFRRMQPDDRRMTHITKVHYERLKPGETFASLTSNDKNKLAEIQLRVINGYYPKGEPEPGTWIKKLKVIPVGADGKLVEDEQ